MHVIITPPCFGSLCTTLLLNHSAAVKWDNRGALNFFHNSRGDPEPHSFQQGTPVFPSRRITPASGKAKPDGALLVPASASTYQDYRTRKTSMHYAL